MKPTPFLTGFRLDREIVSSFDEYPFSIPAIRKMKRVKLHPSVTFFVGENGSGKSTLVEALAVKSRFNPEGGGRNLNFANRESHSVLSKYLVGANRSRGCGWILSSGGEFFQCRDRNRTIRRP